jgi:hypothetical protein
MVETIAASLASKKRYKDSLISLLQHVVLPNLNSPVGYLRIIACRVVSALIEEVNCDPADVLPCVGTGKCV